MDSRHMEIVSNYCNFMPGIVCVVSGILFNQMGAYYADCPVLCLMELLDSDTSSKHLLDVDVDADDDFERGGRITKKFDLDSPP